MTKTNKKPKAAAPKPTAKLKVRNSPAGGRLTDEGRAAISRAQKARHAKARRAKKNA